VARKRLKLILSAEVMVGVAVIFLQGPEDVNSHVLIYKV